MLHIRTFHRILELLFYFICLNLNRIYIKNYKNSICEDYSLKKVRAVFVHAGDEFFNIGKFMIIGTFLSSIFQTTVSLNNSMYIPIEVSDKVTENNIDI